MSDITEGLGGAVEGALLGRAVEPRATSSKHGADIATAVEDGAGATCLNCGATLVGPHCHQCGQKRSVHRTLTAIGHDLMHGVLHLDGKLWHTLPLLAFKPGQLTRRYIEGERARFVSPMAMFLFSVFAMFAVFQMVGISTPTTLEVDRTAQELIQQQGSEEADRIRREIDTLPESDPRRAELEQDLRFIEGALAGDGRNENAEEANGESEPEASFDLRDLEIRVTGVDFIDDGIVKKWKENPGLMLYKLQANAYKFSWLLIPLSIPFLWLMFAWKRAFRAYDHAIFVTYSLSFMSLLFITASVAGAAGVPNWAIVLPVLLIPPIHLYKQLRGAYRLRRFSAIWRLGALSIFIWVVVGLFLQVMLLLGAF
ncbi:MAG: DUF3667 domain-containing protein [Erythrobacter sp.]